MTDPTPANFEQEPRIVEELVVLDLDRTLLNTSIVAQFILACLANYEIDSEHISAAVEYVEAQAGKDFSLFDYIKEEFSESVLEAIIEDIVEDDGLLEEMKSDLLCLGADKLVYALESQEIPHIILTHGEPKYQEFKVALFRRLISRDSNELPAVVTSSQNKSEWVIDQWFNDEEGPGELPAGIMGERLQFYVVSILDDKISNLNSTDERVAGVLVDNRASADGNIVTTAEVAEAVAEGIRLVDIAHLYDERKNWIETSNVYELHPIHPHDELEQGAS